MTESAHIVVAGAGGNTGSHLLPHLARLPRVTRLTLVDPDIYTAEDLRAMGLPQPGELIRERQADGTILIKQLPPKKSADFVCDSPVHE